LISDLSPESLFLLPQAGNSSFEFGFLLWNFRKKGAVAQSVEQRTENPCVGGSIPPHTTEI
jgi:hypothetical protein